MGVHHLCWLCKKVRLNRNHVCSRMKRVAIKEIRRFNLHDWFCHTHIILLNLFKSTLQLSSFIFKILHCNCSVSLSRDIPLPEGCLPISATTGIGLDVLRQEIQDIVIGTTGRLKRTLKVSQGGSLLRYVGILEIAIGHLNSQRHVIVHWYPYTYKHTVNNCAVSEVRDPFLMYLHLQIASAACSPSPHL